MSLEFLLSNAFYTQYTYIINKDYDYEMFIHYNDDNNEVSYHVILLHNDDVLSVI